MESGILRGAFVIATPPAFQPTSQVAVTDFGDSTFALLNVGTNVSVSPLFPSAASPLGLVITPDGTRSYTEGFFSPAAVNAYNFTTGTTESNISLNGDRRSTPGQTQGIAMAPLFGTNHLAAYVVSGTQASSPFIEELYIIDADPTSPTFDTVIKTVPTGAPNPATTHGSLAVTPDGHYAFVNEFERNFTGNLIILDLSTGASNMISDASVVPGGISFFQPNMEISQDAKLLILDDDAGELLVMDVGTDPLHPALVTRLVGTPPAGFQPLGLGGQRIVGQRLYAFDSVQNVLDIFNFQPAALPANFTELQSFALGTFGDGFGVVPDVTPDGSLMYIPLHAENAVAVVDINKVLANNPSALITKIGVGITPIAARVRPGTPVPAAGSPTAIVTVTPIQGVTVSLTGASAGTVSVATTNTTPFSAPAGFQIGGIPTYYEITSTSSFSTAVVCFTYNPAQVPSPESSLRLAHYNTAIDPSTGQVTGWEDVTVSGFPNTTTHTICGQVTSFSPFVIGVSSPDFLFQSLLDEISALSPSETPAGIMRSLRASVLAARNAHQRGQNNAAVNILQALIAKLGAMSGTTIGPSDAANLAGEAQALIADLE